MSESLPKAWELPSQEGTFSSDPSSADRRMSALSPEGLLFLAKRNFLLVSLVVLISTTTAVLYSFSLTPLYESYTEFVVNTDYFRNPVASNVLSEEYDASELQSRRDALVRRVVGPEFISSFFTEQSLFPEGMGEKERRLTVDVFLEKLHFEHLGKGRFLLKARLPSPEIAQTFTVSAVEEIVSSLADRRARRLTLARDAIERRARELGLALRATGSSKQLQEIEALRLELLTLVRQLENLKRSYTELHPKVKKLLIEKQKLGDQIRSAQDIHEGAEVYSADALIATAETREPLEAQFEKFLGQVNSLKILESLEGFQGEPEWFISVREPSLPLSKSEPRRLHYLIAGLSFGILLSACLVALRELRRYSSVSTEVQLQRYFGSAYLGHLPSLNSGFREEMESALLEYQPKPSLPWGERKELPEL